MPPQYGYLSTYKPAKPAKVATNGLALAAAGASSPANPFGFRTTRNTTGYGGAPSTAPVPARKPVTAATSPVTAPIAKPSVNPTVLTPAGAPTPGGYDINTDPSLQSVTALTGMSDEQANAAANKQRYQQLLGYGDPGLAQSVLGDASLAAAAAGNPSSTLAQLGQQRDRNLQALTEGLNQSNLLYSGYRVTQEQQAAQDYQNALASAAGTVGGNLDTISSNLTGTLSANQQQRIQAMQAAADRAMQDAIANGTAGGTDTGGDVLPPDVAAARAAAGPQPLLGGSFTVPGLATAKPQPLLGGSFTVPSLAAAAGKLTPAEIAARNRRNAA